MACKLLVPACGTYFPDQGSNPGPLHWDLGPPGKSAQLVFPGVSPAGELTVTLDVAL